MKIPNIRLLNQQLLSPLFSQPKELVCRISFIPVRPG